MGVANQLPEVNPIPVHPARSRGREKAISRGCSESVAGFPAATRAGFSWHLMSVWILNTQVVMTSAVARASKPTRSRGSCRPAGYPGAAAFGRLTQCTSTFSSACCFPLVTCLVTGVAGVVSLAFGVFQPHQWSFCPPFCAEGSHKQLMRTY